MLLCDACNKNPATVHLTEIVNDQTSEVHLCESCAKKKGNQVKEALSIGDLLASIAEVGKGTRATNELRLKCTSCGMKYADFKKSGRLGCGKCYDAFRDSLLSLLKGIHGTTHHAGSIPLKSDVNMSDLKMLQMLKRNLQRAIETEEFEEAARFRDEIKNLQHKSRKKPKSA